MTPATVAMRPFVPGGPDFEAAQRFYTALGVTRDFVSDARDIAGFSCEGGSFLLQNAAFPGWNDNFMMNLAVADLDAIAYVFAPGGPLWHIIQA